MNAIELTSNWLTSTWVTSSKKDLYVNHIDMNHIEKWPSDSHWHYLYWLRLISCWLDRILSKSIQQDLASHLDPAKSRSHIWYKVNLDPDLSLIVGLHVFTYDHQTLHYCQDQTCYASSDMIYCAWNHDNCLGKLCCERCRSKVRSFCLPRIFTIYLLRVTWTRSRYSGIESP